MVAQAKILEKLAIELTAETASLRQELKSASLLIKNFNQQLNQQSKQAAAGVNAAAKAMQGVNTAASSAAAGVTKLGSASAKTGFQVQVLNRFIGRLIFDNVRAAATIIGTVASVNALFNAIRTGVTNAQQFNSELRNITTVTDLSGKQVQALSKNILKLSADLQTPALDLASAQYQILSSGITDTSQAFTVLGESAKLAKAGLSSNKEAADLVTSAYLAFGAEAKPAAESFFKTVQLSKATAEGLGESFGQVAPTARNLGITLNELNAATATLTNTGLSASESQIALRQAFLSLIKESPRVTAEAKRLGIEFDIARLKSVGLVKFLDELRQASGNNEKSLARLFGRVQGLNAIISLTGNQFGNLKKNFEEIEGSTGALDEAVKKQMNTVSELGTTWDNFLITTGQTLIAQFEPILQDVIAAIKGMSTESGTLGGSLIDLVVQLVKVIIELLKLIGNFSTAIGLGEALKTVIGVLAIGFDGLRTTLELVNTVLNAVITGLERMARGDFSGAIRAVTADLNDQALAVAKAAEARQSARFQDLFGIKNDWEFSVGHFGAPKPTTKPPPLPAPRPDPPPLGGRKTRKPSDSIFRFKETDLLKENVERLNSNLKTLDTYLTLASAKMSRFADENTKAALTTDVLQAKINQIAKTLKVHKDAIFKELGGTVPDKDIPGALQSRIDELVGERDSIGRGADGKLTSKVSGATKDKLARLQDTIARLKELRSIYVDLFTDAQNLNAQIIETGKSLADTNDEFAESVREFNLEAKEIDLDTTLRKFETSQERLKGQLERDLATRRITTEEYYKRLLQLTQDQYSLEIQNVKIILEEEQKRLDFLEELNEKENNSQVTQAKVMDQKKKIRDLQKQITDLTEDEAQATTQISDEADNAIIQKGQEIQSSFEQAIESAIVTAFSSDGPLAAVKNFATAIGGILISAIAKAASQALTNGLQPMFQQLGSALSGAGTQGGFKSGIGAALGSLRNFGKSPLGKAVGVVGGIASAIGAFQSGQAGNIGGALTSIAGSTLAGFTIGGPIGAAVGAGVGIVASIVGAIFGSSKKKKAAAVKAEHDRSTAQHLALRGRIEDINDDNIATSNLEQLLKDVSVNAVGVGEGEAEGIRSDNIAAVKKLIEQRAKTIKDFIKEVGAAIREVQQQFTLAVTDIFNRATVERKFALENLQRDIDDALLKFADSEEAKTKILQLQTEKRKLIEQGFKEDVKDTVETLQELFEKRDEISNANVFTRAKSTEQLKKDQLDAVDKDIAAGLLKLRAVQAESGAQGFTLPGDIAGLNRFLGTTTVGSNNTLQILINGAQDPNAVGEEVRRQVAAFFQKNLGVTFAI